MGVVARKHLDRCKNCQTEVEPGVMHIITRNITALNDTDGTLIVGECIPSINNWLE